MRTEHDVVWNPKPGDVVRFVLKETNLLHPPKNLNTDPIEVLAVVDGLVGFGLYQNSDKVHEIRWVRKVFWCEPSAWGFWKVEKIAE